MASIAFLAFTKSAAGAALSGTQLFVGGLFAGFVDQAIILPRLFPGPDNTGPKFDDTNLQSATEGAPINRCYGSASRMGGQVIWISDLQKVQSLAATSGKGGGYKVTGDEYKIDVAVAFCGNEVEGVNRIWADGKLLWTDDPDLSISETTISSEFPASQAYTELRQTPSGNFDDDRLASLYSGQSCTVSGFPRKGTFVSGNPAGANVLFFNGGKSTGDTSISLDANGSSLSGNVAKFDSFTINHGGSIGVRRYYFTSTTALPASVNIQAQTGSGLAANVTDNTQITIESGCNGTYTVNSSGTDLAGGYDWVRLANTTAQDIAAGSTITVTQSGVAFDPAKLEDITIYTGTDHQDPDPTIESWLGVGQVPGFRARTYALLKGLVLTDYGNRPPNLSARCTASSTITYADALEEMIGESGIKSDYHDTSALTDPAPGYYVQGPLATASKLQPYAVSGEFVAREEDGVLVFYPRLDVPTRTIDSDDLGAFTGDLPDAYPASVTDRDDLDLPRAVTVTFLDPSKDHQAGSVTERAMGVASGTTPQSKLPLTLTTAEARDIAKHALHSARAHRQRMAIALPPSYLGLSENERLALTTLGEDWEILTQRVDVAPDWTISVEGIREDTGVLEFAESDDAPLDVGVSKKTKAPPALRLQIMDSAPLTDAHSGVLGFYYAASSYQENLWGGAVLYASTDGGDTFKYVTTVYERATMGIATDALADGPVGYFDRINTVTVELDSGELESASEADVLKGANRMWIQASPRGEVIGFTTATLVGTRTYTLSGLLRGLRDTRDYTNGHAAGDTVVLLANGVHFQETNAASVNVQRVFKLVASGGAVADAESHTERLQGYTMRPFAPVHVDGSRDGSNNLTVTAVKRTRRLVSILSEIGSPGADPESAMTYEMDVMDGVDVLRTVAASTLSFSYTAAQQTTDGLTPGDPVTVRVYAVSEVVGRGNYTEATV